MHLPDLQKKATRLVVDNASVILTAGGAVGTVATAVLTARGTFKAAELIAAEDKKWEEDASDLNYDSIGEMHTKDKVKLVWKCYVPPVFVGSATIGSIVMANRISAQRAAALAAAYGILDNRFEDYRDKVAEKLTGPKKQSIDDELAQKRVDEDPVSKQVVIVAGGDVLCYDTITGRYFRSSVERIKRAEAELNQELFDTQMASLSSFYENIGLPRTTMSDILGWSAFDEGIVEFNISTTLSEDKQPCLVITPSRTPNPNYTRLID